ncbi:Uridylate kinase [Lasiodiplodia theobromae]|uniref:Uridylate kinase n=1 Tax=Lasiodiplodia theobromae TaxID=45133 RepID=UPI0015C31566|nr:Uridylate kinase [Lasiodiplodia theobromae]KAF4534693.1 Uridylate kinase [Lasiodiplodia theobromae]
MTWNSASSFLVTWQDPSVNNMCVLGNVFAGGSKHCSVAFGCSDKPGEVMLSIHLSLKLSVSSKGHFNTYLVIPVDALDTRDASYYDILVPPEAPQFKKAGVKEGKDFVRCHFSLKAPGHVVMQVPATPKQPSEHARGLLLSLKSLSEAMSFEVYLPRTTASENVVERFFRGLRSGDATSPEIDYQSTFSGRKVAINDWETYQIHSRDTLTPGWNPLIEENPPPYEEVSEQAPQVVQETPVPPEQGPQRTVRFEDEMSGDEGARVKRQKVRQAEAALQANGDRKGGPRERRRLKRKADEAVSDTESGSTRKSWRMSRQTDVKSAVLRHMSANAIVSCSVFASKGHNRAIFDESQFSWFCDAVLWLKAVWAHQPDAHDAYSSQLRDMCRAIRLKETEKYQRIREECVDLFLKRDPKGKRASSEKGPWEVKATDRATWISRLIFNRLGIASDTLIYDELVALQHLACEWEKIGGDEGVPKPGCEEDYTRLKASFNTQMAACVLVALYKDDRLEGALEDAGI